MEKRTVVAEEEKIVDGRDKSEKTAGHGQRPPHPPPGHGKHPPNLPAATSLRHLISPATIRHPPRLALTV